MLKTIFSNKHLNDNHEENKCAEFELKKGNYEEYRDKEATKVIGKADHHMNNNHNDNQACFNYYNQIGFNDNDINASSVAYNNTKSNCSNIKDYLELSSEMANKSYLIFGDMVESMYLDHEAQTQMNYINNNISENQSHLDQKEIIFKDSENLNVNLKLNLNHDSKKSIYDTYLEFLKSKNNFLNSNSTNTNATAKEGIGGFLKNNFDASEKDKDSQNFATNQIEKECFLYNISENLNVLLTKGILTFFH